MTRSDYELVQRFQEGDRGAFEALVAPYSARLFNTLVHMTNDHSAAEDLLQETYLAAYRALGGFRADSSVHTWLHRIATNKALTWLRQRRGRIHWESLDEPVVTGRGEMQREVADERSTPERASEQSELGEVLRAAVASLGDGYRMVFTLREIDGLEYEEIARLCACSQEAVRTRISRARKELKERLRPYLEGREVPVP